MTPKEKAQEIYDKCHEQIQLADKYGYLLRDDEKELSKKLALIAVDEIISVCGNHQLESSKIKWDFIWYKSVKEEINKL